MPVKLGCGVLSGDERCRASRSATLLVRRGLSAGGGACSSPFPSADRRPRRTLALALLCLRPSRCAGVSARSNELRPEPEPIQIERQGIAGNKSATECFDALKMCHDGKREISSINWDVYRDILSPTSNESCKDRAAQILIDWLRWKRESQRAALEFWLHTIDNHDLLLRIFPPDYVNPLEASRTNNKNNLIKQGNASRQKKQRLRERRLVPDSPKKP